ncbi:MAG: hypothetical protein PWP52_779 [Bacteroidales bacterium]|nr:hypothetical protein [Bacteroidales bacterium]
MRRNYKIIGYLLFIFGLISILLLLAKGFQFYKIDNEYVFAILVFIAILFPTLGVQFIKKSKA